MQEFVILVDSNDNEIGSMEKMKTHEQKLLHRAFSVLIFNDKNELLLQQRAIDKYHSGGLWTNTCCSHPRPGESVEDAAKRRLQEEMGFECELKKVFDFIYKADFENGLTEHEFDHVLTGRFSGEPVINKAEVENWKYISIDDLNQNMQDHPEEYTPWFKILMDIFNNERLIEKV